MLNIFHYYFNTKICFYFLLDYDVSDVFFAFSFLSHVWNLGRDRDPGGQVAAKFLLRLPVVTVAIKNLLKNIFSHLFHLLGKVAFENLLKNSFVPTNPWCSFLLLF